MCACVTTSSRTCSTRRLTISIARSRCAIEPGSCMPQSKRTTPWPDATAHALQCGTPGNGSGSRSRQTPGSTRSPRPTSRLRTVEAIERARYAACYYVGHGQAQPRAGAGGEARGADERVPLRDGRPARPPRRPHAEDAPAVRRDVRRQPALPGGRLAARGGVPVRAPRRALGDRRRADRGAEGAAHALPRRHAGRAPVRPRRAARARRRALPGAAGAVTSQLDPAAFAELLAGYCLEVQPGQQVLVRSTTFAAPLLLELQRAILARDAWPHLRVELPGQGRSFYDHARDRHLDDVPALTLEEAKRLDANLGIHASADVRELVGVDPERITRLARARRPVRGAIMKKRWCSTLWPTEAFASQAGMTLDEFEAFVRGALFLDQPHPVAAWGGLRAFQDKLIPRLQGARDIRIEADGTDLTLRVAGRTWINSDGKRNMPSGEVFTGPHESSANGRIRFTVRSAPEGVDVDGVELEFRDGEVVDARAATGDEYLQRALETDGGARYLGELGIGTNFGIDRPTGTILFDEKIGGTVHLALGRSYPETGGRNVSAVHWDLICDQCSAGGLSADGETVLEDGRFAGPMEASSAEADGRRVGAPVGPP